MRVRAALTRAVVAGLREHADQGLGVLVVGGAIVLDGLAGLPGGAGDGGALRARAQAVLAVQPRPVRHGQAREQGGKQQGAHGAGNDHWRALDGLGIR